jgi:ABC-2 type transport system permease protein
VIRVFGYLTWCTIRNRVGRQLRHLRSPRYFVACLVGGAYIWAMVVQRPPATSPGALNSGLVELVAAVLLAGATAWAWIFGVERRVLAFTPPEVTLLFPAPVTRQGLIQYKLLRTQLLILFNTLLWTLILSYERFGVSAWLRAFAIWMLLTTLSFHRLGASFVRTSLADHGRFGARHRLVSLTVIAAVVGTVFWSLIAAQPALHAASDAGVAAILHALGDMATQPPVSALLYPFRLMVRPLVADSMRAWLLATAPAAAVMALHYLWVIRSDTAFEEAAAEVSLDQVRHLAASRTSQASVAQVARRLMPAPFRLAPVGWPGGAILWKNLIAAVRMRRLRHSALALAAVGTVGALFAVTHNETVAGITGWLAATWGGALVVIGPQWIRNDLRSDLLKLDLLRSYPTRGRTIVMAEVMSSALVLTLIELSLLGFAYLALLSAATAEPSLEMRTAIRVGAVFCLPVINFMSMLIQNAAALLYPDWVHLGVGRPGGVEALGQNMLALIAFVALLALTLVVPLVAAGVVVVLLQPVIGMWCAIPAAVAGIIVAAVEAMFAVDWLGNVFDRTDPPEAGLTL